MKKEKNLYYSKVKKYYWSVYDLNDYELNIASFDDLNELHDFITRISGAITRDSLYNNINFKIPVKQRYLIVRDKIQTLDNIEEF